MAFTITKTAKPKKKKSPAKVSPARKPADLSLEQWQIILRRQIALDQKYKIKNTGTHPVFSDFSVTNPKTRGTYRVAIGGEALGMNYCSCPDFAINTLGTCKHIESVLKKVTSRKKGKAALREGFRRDYSVVTLRYGAQRRVAFSFGEKAGGELKHLVKEFFDDDLFLTEKGFRDFSGFVQRAEKLKDAVRYHDDALELIASVQDEETRRQRVARMFPQGIKGPRWSRLIKAGLYPYQREGVLFAAQKGRVLIADEMGLGKTIQAIAASEVMARCFGVEKVLVICPASLKHQWKLEIDRFTKRSARLIEGPLFQRHSQYGQEEFFKIVNYDVIHRDFSAISRWAPDLIILDEAQRIKNWKTRMARSVKQLRSPHAVVLTGTPLENRLEELHSIVAFIDCHHLGPLFRFLDKHQRVDESGKVVGYKDLHDLGRTLETIMIRRRSHEVLKQLPGRVDKNYFVEMTPGQWNVHDENRTAAAKIIHKWRRYHFLTDEDKQRLMMCLQNMRMVCDSTYLIDQSTFQGNKVGELETLLKEIFEEPEIKIVIFSQWLRMMELVKNMLTLNKWGHVFLNGGVPSRNRGELVKEFRSNPLCRVFLSTEAGSTGLNLQNAGVVINLDLPWNPAVLEQRIGRVHRLGQTRTVRVINLIAQGGIEHGMLGLLKFKQSMFSGVLDKGDNDVFMGESRFSRFMKTVEDATGALKTGEESAAVIQESKEDRETARQEGEDSADLPVPNTADLNPVNPGTTASPPASAPTIIDLLRMGAAFLNQASESLEKTGGEQKQKKGDSLFGALFRGACLSEDGKTGQKILQIPVPEDAVLQQAAKTVEIFLNRLKL